MNCKGKSQLIQVLECLLHRIKWILGVDFESRLGHVAIVEIMAKAATSDPKDTGNVELSIIR